VGKKHHEGLIDQNGGEKVKTRAPGVKVVWTPNGGWGGGSGWNLAVTGGKRGDGGWRGGTEHERGSNRRNAIWN